MHSYGGLHFITDSKPNYIGTYNYLTLKCDSCQRFFSADQGQLVEKERFICNDCLRNEVNDNNAEFVIRDVIKLLNRAGFDDIIYDNFRYHIISKKEMNFRMGPGTIGCHVPTDYKTDERGIYGIQEDIYILSHLTQLIFRETIAHEMIHSGQMRNYVKEFFDYFIDDKAKMISEGFAQMGSYLVFKDVLNHRDSEYVRRYLRCLLESTNKYYGRAFKMIYNQFQSYQGSEQDKWYYIIKCARKGQLKVI